MKDTYWLVVTINGWMNRQRKDLQLFGHLLEVGDCYNSKAGRSLCAKVRHMCIDWHCCGSALITDYFSKHIKYESVTELMGEFTSSPIPPSWWMIAGCVSTYIGSALRGFQLKLSGTCTQFPTEIKVGKQINMHGGKQSSKPTSPPYTHIHDTHRSNERSAYVHTFRRHLCSNTSHSHTYCPT